MTDKGIFITGTDTGVGKTVVTAGLLAALRGEHIDAVPMKPVQSGCENSEHGLTVPDLEFALSLAKVDDMQQDREFMCPYAFEPACSPHLAAEKAGIEISIEKIDTAFRELSSRHEVVVVEGAGGLFVPIVKEVMMIDLAVQLDLPVLLVARAGLGTINHTMLSVRAIQSAGLTIAGIVFNRGVKDGVEYIENDNLKTIARLTDVPVWGCLPYMENVNEELIAAWLSSMPSASEFMEKMA